MRLVPVKGADDCLFAKKAASVGSFFGLIS